jgi:hypothetical protein
MSRILALHVDDDGTLKMPVDDVVNELRPFFEQLRPPRPHAAEPRAIADIAAGTTNANRTISNVTTRVLGWSLRETTGAAPAVIELVSGTDATGDVVLTVSLAPAESARDWYGDTGVRALNGLFLVRISGQAKGAVYVDARGAPQ